MQSASHSRSVRWGIIGCGDVTEIKSGPGFQRAQGSQLVAVMRRNGALAADYARRHGVPRWYSDARSLVADPEVDAIYVATPPGAHLDGALLAAAAGKPCYVEKPLARHTPECDAMLQAFAAAKQKLFVAYYRRALPRFVQVRDLLARGAIGRLTGITYRHASHPASAPIAPGAWRLSAENSGGGLFLDIGSHVLDFLDFCVGPLQDVQGHAARLGSAAAVEDSVALSFRTPAGVLGAATWNFTSHARDDTLDFFGTAGRISLPFFSAEPVRLEAASGIQELTTPNPPHVAEPLIQLVTDDLLGRGTCPSTGESARRTSAVMDRVLSDYYGGRADAFWQRAGTWPGFRSGGCGVPPPPPVPLQT
jgi:predicted dehydrogenase